jgi:hypothetical protein
VHIDPIRNRIIRIEKTIKPESMFIADLIIICLNGLLIIKPYKKREKGFEPSTFRMET